MRQTHENTHPTWMSRRREKPYLGLGWGLESMEKVSFFLGKALGDEWNFYECWGSGIKRTRIYTVGENECEQLLWFVQESLLWIWVKQSILEIYKTLSSKTNIIWMVFSLLEYGHAVVILKQLYSLYLIVLSIVLHTTDPFVRVPLGIILCVFSNRSCHELLSSLFCTESIGCLRVGAVETHRNKCIGHRCPLGHSWIHTPLTEASGIR